MLDMKIGSSFDLCIIKNMDIRIFRPNGYYAGKYLFLFHIDSHPELPLTPSKTSFLHQRRRPATTALLARLRAQTHAGSRDGLLYSEDQLQSQLKRLQEEPDAVAEERERDGDGCNHSVEPEVVCGRDDDQEDKKGVGERCESVESTEQSIEARLATGFTQKS